MRLIVIIIVVPQLLTGLRLRTWFSSRGLFLSLTLCTIAAIGPWHTKGEVADDNGDIRETNSHGRAV